MVITGDSKMLIWLGHCLLIFWPTRHSRDCKLPKHSTERPDFFRDHLWVHVESFKPENDLLLSVFSSRYLQNNEIDGTLTIPEILGLNLRYVSLQNNNITGLVQPDPYSAESVLVMWVIYSQLCTLFKPTCRGRRILSWKNNTTYWCALTYWIVFVLKWMFCVSVGCKVIHCAHLLEVLWI